MGLLFWPSAENTPSDMLSRIGVFRSDDEQAICLRRPCTSVVQFRKR